MPAKWYINYLRLLDNKFNFIQIFVNNRNSKMDTTELIKEADEHFKNLQYSKARIEEALYVTEQTLKNLITRIGQSDKLEDSKPYFFQIAKLNEFGWKCYRNEIGLSTQMQKFMSDFERVDDLRQREFLWRKIRLGEYI